MARKMTGFDELKQRLQQHVALIYPDLDGVAYVDRLLATMAVDEAVVDTPAHDEPRLNKWDQSTVFMITYGDSLRRDDEAPLQTLQRFMTDYLSDVVSAVHVLPFYPYSSDDGFSVIDYEAVNPALGDWQDISTLAQQSTLMADLVINHCSQEHRWFQQFLADEQPGCDYIQCADASLDWSGVVRPRAHDLLRPVETPSGTKHAWCTFSHDQIDVDFSNPDVLIEFIQIIRGYLDRGVRVIRLDAVGFLWKEHGTTCMHLPQTHEVIKLLHTLTCAKQPDVVIITETNVPNKENLSYFGDGDEAHAIYNFSLPPLLIHALLSGDGSHLKRWLMRMPPAELGTTYFNFIASHDGIGLRPIEGLLGPEEVDGLIETLRSFGGEVSMRRLSDGSERPYEANIALFDAMKGTLTGGPDQWQVERFLCAHTIMMSLEGMPAIYIHSLLGTENDRAAFEASGHKRHINRHQWDDQRLRALLADSSSHHHQVFNAMRQRLAVRVGQEAFHPNATQYCLHLADGLWGVWRQDIRRRQSIFAIANLRPEPQCLPVNQINLTDTQRWADLLSGQPITDLHGELELAPYQCMWISNRAGC